MTKPTTKEMLDLTDLGPGARVDGWVVGLEETQYWKDRETGCFCIREFDFGFRSTSCNALFGLRLSRGLASSAGVVSMREPSRTGM
jgi:hypothetical protein